MQYPLFVDTAPALAQDPDGGTDPGQIQRRIEETRPKPVKPAPGPTTVPEAPAPGVRAEEQPAFVLSAVVMEGGTVFEPGDLAQLYEDFLARSVTLDEVAEIARRITRKYQEAGYVLSRAVVPPQQVQGGLLRIRVIEGYVARVSFEGAAAQEDLFMPYAEKITAARPTTLAVLERYLILINDLAGITVLSSALSKIDDEGAYEVIVAVDYDALDAVAYLDNRGTPSAGRLQAWLSGAANTMLGLGERAQLGLFTVPDQPQELLYGEFSYQQPVGSEGTTVKATASASHIDAGADLAALDSDGRGVRFALRASHPVLLSRSGSLSVAGTLDYLDIGEDRLGRTNFEDSLRVFRFGLDYRRDDSWNGTTSLAAEISQGVEALGASKRGDAALSRVDGGGSFTKLTAQIARTQGIGNNFGVQVALKGQFSADPLLSAEEFALGGSQFGRGYDFGELTGDDGLAASVEVRYGQSVDGDLVKAYQVYGFYDFGMVWNDNAADDGRESLASAGAGLRLSLPRSIFTTIELAKPLTRDVSTTGDRNLRVFFSLSAGF